MIRYTLAAAVILLSPAAGPARADDGHSCKGGEAARYAYGAARDTLCRSEAEHVCRCRKEARRIPAKGGGFTDTTGAYYDASRNLCLDNWDHFQCLEKDGVFKCLSPGRCLCAAKPPRCQEGDLADWKDHACGEGDCEDTRLLRGREPKAGIKCKGGGRWKCGCVHPANDRATRNWVRVGSLGGCYGEQAF